MSDDKIIDFGSFQKKLSEEILTEEEKDIVRRGRNTQSHHLPKHASVEEYMYSMYTNVSSGSMSPLDFSKSINEFLKKNNISVEKFGQMQEKLLERYGFDPKNIEEEMKRMGIDMNESAYVVSKKDKEESYSVKDFGDKLAFFERYEGIEEKTIMHYILDNGVNQVKFIMDGSILTLVSEKKIDLSDPDVNTFIAGYRQANKEKIKVVICEATNVYDYF